MGTRGLLFAVTLLVVPLAEAAQAPACDDCKFKPCLQSEITRANRMREMYSRVGRSAKTMKEYEETVDAEGDKILAEEQANLQGNPDCATRFPDLNDMVEQKRWRALGWGITFDDKQRAVGARFSAATDPEKCKLRESQIDKLKEILPCLAIAEATEAHESNHVEQCTHRKPATPRDMGNYEVKGYDAELKVLKAAKAKLDKKCRPPPSISDKKPRDEIKGKLRRSMNRVSSYAATL